MAKHIDICGIGNSIVDQQFKVTEDVISETGLVLDQMSLASPEDHQRILTILNNHQCDSISSCGGSATNTIVAASYFGSRCHHMCFVANDDAGQTYLSSLSDANVSYCFGTDTSRHVPTGKCLVLVTPDGKRTMSTCLGMSQFFDVHAFDLAAVHNSKYVYLEGYMVTSDSNFNTACQLLETAKESDSAIALSLSDPWVAQSFHYQLTQLCDIGIDILFCNDAEAQAFTQTSSLERAANSLKHITNRFAITRGNKGALLFDGTKEIIIDGLSVDVVDTNGAGDIFAGAFLHHVIQGASFEEAGINANKAAARLVQHFGARLSKETYQTIF